MAVEIPVYVDIEAAFRDAAKRVPAASAPLKKSISELNEELSFNMEAMNTFEINSPLWKQAAANVQLLTEQIAMANTQVTAFTTNAGSIRQASAYVAELNRQWEEMSFKDKFTSEGKLTAEAKALKEEYQRVTAEIKVSAQTLAQMEAEEERLLSLKKKGEQSRKYENAILNSTIKSMRVLQEQERILSARLQTAPVGSAKFQDLAAKLAQVRREMQLAEMQARNAGAAFAGVGAGSEKATAGITATNAALTKQQSIFQRLSYYMSGYMLLFAGIRFVHNIRETTAELELQRVALGGILNDTEKASELFREIKAAALKSPFEIKDLVTYTKQLAAYRVETEKLFETTQRLADISAGLGVDMNRLILAYGQVRAAAVLRGQELRQFTEAGIPLVDELAKKFRQLGREGTTTADVFELIQRRAVPFKMIEEIFNDMTNAGGVFYNMQEKQSETLKGQWMKLKDSLTVMYDEMGNTKSIHNAMTSLIKTANTLTRSWREVAGWLGTLIGVIITYKTVAKSSVLATNAMTLAEARELAIEKARAVSMPKFVAALLGKTAAEKASIWVSNQMVVAQTKLALSNTVLERSFWKLYAAIMANPYAAAAAALAALGLGIYTLVKNSREAEFSVDQLESSLSKFSSATKRAADTENLVSSYETLGKKIDQLKNKADKTEKEENELSEATEKLVRVTRELANAFPSAATGIENESGALEINIEKVKKLSKAELELELARLRRDKNRAKERVKDLEDEKNYIIGLQQAGGKWYTKALPGGGSVREFHVFDDEELADYGERLNEIRKELDPIKELLGQIEDIDFIGPMPAKGKAAEQTLVGWKQRIVDIQKEKFKVGQTPVYSDDDIEKMGTMYDLWKDTKKGIKECEVELAGLIAIQNSLTDEDKKNQNQEAIDQKKAEIAFRKAIQQEFHFRFSGDSEAYKKDPFLDAMKERIKFMKDFQKGYEDLRKSLSDDKALARESEIMKTRGLALGISEKDQAEAARNLASWYEKAREEVWKKAKAHGATGSIESFLSQEIKDTSNRGKALKDFQALLQSLFDEQTDLETTQAKKNLEKTLAKLKDDIKRSETAKNFFKDIFDLTGDKELATTMTVSVYGEPGDDLGERIKKSIQGTLEAQKYTDADPIFKQLMDAANKMDFRDLMRNMDQIPENLQSAVKEASSAIEKHNSETIKSYAKLLTKFDDLEQQRINIERQADKDIADLREGLRLEIEGIDKNQSIQDKESAKEAARAREAAAEASVERELEYNRLKLKRDYRLFFESIGTISLESARKIAKAEKKILYEQFEANEISLSRLRRELERIDEQLKKYEEEKNPFATYLTKGIDGVIEKIKQAGDNLTALTGNLKDDDGKFSIPDGLEKAINVIGRIFGGDFFGVEGVSGRKNVFDQMKEQLGENEEAWEKMAEKTEEKLSAMATNMSQGIGWADFWVSFAGNGIKAFDQIAQRSKNVEGDVADGWNKVAKFIMGSAAAFSLGAPITGGILGQYIELDDAWERFTGLNEKAMSGFEKFKSGDIIGAIVDNVEGWMEVFDKNTKKIDRQIKDQDKLLQDLEYQYSRLDVAIQKSFGSDYIYNYNKQVETLKAEAEAYRKQAELEESKGDKKRDQTKIDEYNKQARNVEDKISDTQSQLSEFFAGTDLTSAAKDFANSWIEAYKQFGNMTDAMKEKFQDMIQEMITNSLAADIMQRQLAPIFKMINELSQDDGILSAADIASIADRTNEIIPMINDSLSTLMAELTASGYNIRQQTTQFTGISRNIAGATEESINGLAAGINTQNFYMQHIDMTVTMILEALTGESATGARKSQSGTSTNPYQDQMLEYASSIPLMRDDMYAIRSMLERVIRPNASKAEHYVSVRM